MTRSPCNSMPGPQGALAREMMAATPQRVHEAPCHLHPGAEFRSLAEVDLRLGPLNVLIGPNDSGKTIVLNVRRSGVRRAHCSQQGVERCCNASQTRSHSVKPRRCSGQRQQEGRDGRPIEGRVPVVVSQEGLGT